MSMLLHQYGDGALVCLLDIAKAYPSMPHECLTYGLRLIGTPARIYNMVASIYAHSTGLYGVFMGVSHGTGCVACTSKTTKSTYCCNVWVH